MNRQVLRRVLLGALLWISTLVPKTAEAQLPGTVRALGENQHGQLGNGTTTNSATPVPVSGLSDMASVAAGYDHSLGLKSDGTVWAWGDNSAGQLGIGSHTNKSTPTSAFISDVVAIAAGWGHSLALKSNGTVWAWGSNQYGQLGNISINTGVGAESTVPVAVTALTGVVAVAAGGFHSLAVKSDGTVWTWGWNQYGQLGNGTNLGRSYPVLVSNLSGVVAVAAGIAHSLALKSNGRVEAWGVNDGGQLGNGTSTASNVPVATSSLDNVVGIAGGFCHSVAVKSDGTVWNWGSGNGLSIQNTPVQVSGLSNAVAVAAGGAVNIFLGGWSDSIAVKSDGSVWHFALHDGLPPQVISNLPGAVVIAKGRAHILAIINPIVGVYPTSVNFGAIEIGSTSAAQTVTITNIGPDPLVVSSLSIGGANPGDFSVTGPPLPITLPMYATASANVRFTPAATGTRNGALVFGDNGLGSPHMVNLTGTAYTPADLGVSQTVAQSGRRLTFTINVRNNGPGSAANVTLRYTVPAQTQFVSVSGSVCIPPGSLGFGTCNLLTMSSGAQKTVALVVDVTATQSTQIGNTATVSSTTPDPKSSNNSSTLVTNWTPK